MYRTTARVRLRRKILSCLSVIALLVSACPASAAGPFTIVVLPDTQFYCDHVNYPAGLDPDEDLEGAIRESLVGIQTQWIRDSLARENIQGVIHVGDIVEHGGGIDTRDPALATWPSGRGKPSCTYCDYATWGTGDPGCPLESSDLALFPDAPVAEACVDYEWGVCTAAFDIIDGLVPIQMTIGNHDPDGDGILLLGHTRYDRHFGTSFHQLQEGYLESCGGTGVTNTDGLCHAVLMNHPDFPVLTLSIPNGRPATLVWLEEMLNRYWQYPTVISVHVYVSVVNGANGDDLRDFDGSAGLIHQNADGSERRGFGSGDTTGREFWDFFVKRFPQVVLLVAGHFNGENRVSETNDAGYLVHATLQDYQSRVHGGNGWLNPYRFDPDAGTISVQTYSPYLDQYEVDGTSQYVLDVDFARWLDPEHPAFVQKRVFPGILDDPACVGAYFIDQTDGRNECRSNRANDVCVGEGDPLGCCTEFGFGSCTHDLTARNGPIAHCEGGECGPTGSERMHSSLDHEQSQSWYLPHDEAQAFDNLEALSAFAWVRWGSAPGSREVMSMYAPEGGWRIRKNAEEGMEYSVSRVGSALESDIVTPGQWFHHTLSWNWDADEAAKIFPPRDSLRGLSIRTTTNGWSTCRAQGSKPCRPSSLILQMDAIWDFSIAGSDQAQTLDGDLYEVVVLDRDMEITEACAVCRCGADGRAGDRAALCGDCDLGSYCCGGGGSMCVPEPSRVVLSLACLITVAMLRRRAPLRC